MYVPVEAFIRDINQIDLSYNPNDEKDRIKEYILVLESEYCNFEKELKHRQLNIIENKPEEETLFGNGYESTCESIGALSVLIDKVKQITKWEIIYIVNLRVKKYAKEKIRTNLFDSK